ncbi:hypothetical protein D0N36_12885 [Hymenobacter lapidiphilus]|uniref:hypothetical protein n=1 Tax=Hymenobacter sp. CCM 8763 TaxID=2303334 RepID=UPI000E95FFB0|nr:hypothetical protein [Hymenobacter sp. CCM 8763]RFP64651.1 hypothetical protein D0N36_12885 [Hymenobacter sp. CCM 8763]
MVSILLYFHDIRVQYAPPVALLRLQFRRPPANLASFQRSLGAVAQLVEQHTVAESLIDLHGLPDLTIGQQLWLLAQWLPRVAVAAVQHVAFIIPENSLYNQMTVEALHRATRHLFHCEVQFFHHSAAALDWLLSFQNPAAQAALEQEWASADVLLPAG